MNPNRINYNIQKSTKSNNNQTYSERNQLNSMSKLSTHKPNMYEKPQNNDKNS